MASEIPDALIRAAEQLFAERGSDAVSLREINAAAGATNASAIQYHFGDRRGLVKAVLAKHEPAIEQRRHDLLDDYEARQAPDMRELAAALVDPLVAELNVEGGPGYLQLLADLYNRPNPTFEPDRPDDNDSVNRWRRMVEPLLSPQALRLHRRFDALRFAVSETARRGRMNRTDHSRFASQLTDLVTALLSAPVSDQTKQLFDD